MTQLACVVGHLDLELVVDADVTLRIVDGGTVAVGYDLLNLQLAQTLVAEFKNGGNGLAIARLAGIYRRLDSYQFLGSHRECGQQEKR